MSSFMCFKMGTFGVNFITARYVTAMYLSPSQAVCVIGTPLNNKTK